jgi:hypothetical protein
LVGYPYASSSNDFNLIDVDFSFTPLSTYPAAKNVRQLGRDLDKIMGEAVDAANTEAGEAFVIFENIKALFAGHEPDPAFNFFTHDESWFTEVEILTGFEIVWLLRRRVLVLQPKRARGVGEALVQKR